MFLNGVSKKFFMTFVFYCFFLHNSYKMRKSRADNGESVRFLSRLRLGLGAIIYA